MKRFLILAAVGFGTVGTANAQAPVAPIAPAPMGVPAGAAAPVQGVVGGDCGGGGCGGGSVAADGGYAHHDPRFGWSPVFGKLAFWKRDNSCGTCGDRAGLFSRLKSLCTSGGRGGCGAGGVGAPAAFNPYPNGVPGTLVFPQHPFVRSPRDFFMMDVR